MQLENLKGFEVECEKCGCVIRTDTKRDCMFQECPNCHERFGFNRNNDPISRIHTAISAFEDMSGVKVRLVCDEEEK